MPRKRSIWFVITLVFIISIGLSVDYSNNTPNFAAIDDVQARKKAFIEYLKPVIKDINQQRADERRELLQLHKSLQSGKTLSYWNRRKLEAWATRYKVEYRSDKPLITTKQLLLHLDKIPVSMVLAQAALESAWGTSRFAQEANNYFGQWCFKKGCGVVPKERPEDAKHEVKEFSSAEDSLYSYFKNINTHPAYEQLRELRAQAREEGKPLSGLELVDGLENYSGRGQAYIEELRSVIRHNNLE